MLQEDFLQKIKMVVTHAIMKWDFREERTRNIGKYSYHALFDGVIIKPFSWSKTYTFTDVIGIKLYLLKNEASISNSRS